LNAVGILICHANLSPPKRMGLNMGMAMVWDGYGMGMDGGCMFGVCSVVSGKARVLVLWE